ncbi:MAG: hypothetical protein PWP31_1969 [Clostridia bacterium]|nr:hypothetical protein [Clostridia bacterium]
MLHNEGQKVTLADLDTIEPCYTLRPLKEKLESQGLSVLTWKTCEIEGWGETGTVLYPGVRWALHRQGHVIFDVGYGVAGADMLDLIEGIESTPELNVICVINTTRPITSTVTKIVDYVNSLGRVDGLLNNTNLGEETTTDLIRSGGVLLEKAAKILGLPIVATSVMAELADKFGPNDNLGHSIRVIHRYMPQAFW